MKNYVMGLSTWHSDFKLAWLVFNLTVLSPMLQIVLYPPRGTEKPAVATW